MEKNKIIEELYQAIEAFGLMPTIGKFFGAGTRIQIPFSESACNTKLEDLDLSVRSYNYLKRAGYKTVDQVIDAMMQKKSFAITEISTDPIGRKSTQEYWNTDIVNCPKKTAKPLSKPSLTSTKTNSSGVFNPTTKK